MTATEEPSRRAVLEVAEETGLLIDEPQFVGQYAGSVAAHQIFLAEAAGDPRPNRRELQDACWWDGTGSLQVQQHVNAILAIVRNWIKENTGPQNSTEQTGSQHLPALQAFMESLPEA